MPGTTDVSWRPLAIASLTSICCYEYKASPQFPFQQIILSYCIRALISFFLLRDSLCRWSHILRYCGLWGGHLRAWKQRDLLVILEWGCGQFCLTVVCYLNLVGWWSRAFAQPSSTQLGTSSEIWSGPMGDDQSDMRTFLLGSGRRFWCFDS